MVIEANKNHRNNNPVFSYNLYGYLDKSCVINYASCKNEQDIEKSKRLHFMPGIKWYVRKGLITPEEIEKLF